MKKSFKKFLLIVAALYCISAYKDFKQGIADGFYKSGDKPLKESKQQTLHQSGFTEFTLPGIFILS